MDFLEKDLEEIIFNSDRNSLINCGIHIYGKLFRQLRIGNYGVADLVLVDRSYPFKKRKNSKPENYLTITVFELKKDNVGMSAFLQAITYIKGIKRYLDERNFDQQVIFKVVLIGKNIDKNSSFCYLSDLLPYTEKSDRFLTVYSYSYSISGIKFKQEYGFKLIEESFNIKIKNYERF